VYSASLDCLISGPADEDCPVLSVPYSLRGSRQVFCCPRF
jgi:hypothetical protein